MNDKITYHIQVRGEMDEDEINAMSPLHMTREWVGSTKTQFSICTDQSGLIGLMRHLHGLGYVFLAVNCEQSVT